MVMRGLFFLFSCVLFFPINGCNSALPRGYMIGSGTAENKAFGIGIGSAVVSDCATTLMNIRGMEWTKLW